MTYDGMQQVWEEKFIMREREEVMHRRREWQNERMWERKKEERLNSSHTSGQDGRLDKAWQDPEQ